MSDPFGSVVHDSIRSLLEDKVRKILAIDCYNQEQIDFSNNKVEEFLKHLELKYSRKENVFIVEDKYIINKIKETDNADIVRSVTKRRS